VHDRPFYHLKLDQINMGAGQSLNDGLDYWKKHFYLYSWKKRLQEMVLPLGGFVVYIWSDNLAIWRDNHEMLKMRSWQKLTFC
jgi:hypothetical protein